MIEIKSENKVYEIVTLNNNTFFHAEAIIKESNLIFEGIVSDYNGLLDLLKNNIAVHKAKLFVIYQGNEIISYAVVFFNRNPTVQLSYNTHIAYLFVQSLFRKKQIGQQMLEHIINYSVLNKSIAVTLHVSKDNTAALRLYRKNGFIEKTILSNYSVFYLKL